LQRNFLKNPLLVPFFGPKRRTQGIDIKGRKAKLLYGKEQRNFFGLTAELNG
jgi:hypothetical protein